MADLLRRRETLVFLQGLTGDATVCARIEWQGGVSLALKVG
jgi:hypothetical protein